MSTDSSETSPTILSAANVAAFLDRYQHFYDGLLRRLQLHFARSQDAQCGSEPHGVTIECSVIENSSTATDSWVNIIMDIEEVSEIRLILGNHTWTVLSGGLSIGFIGDNTYLAFNEDEAVTREDFIRSNFLIIGKRCTWTIRPYRESTDAGIDKTDR
ncbi:MAG TPA: hypothetical protein VIL85_15930 [Thermomicrobiales bacterium]|jgi:hypothetical protein